MNEQSELRQIISPCVVSVSTTKITTAWAASAI